MNDDATPVRDSTRDTAASFELMAELTQAFAASRCIQSTLGVALERITRELQAASGAIFVLDQPPTLLTCVASRGPIALKGITVPVDRGIIGRAIRKRRGELVDNVSLDPDFFGGVDETTGFRTVSLLCSPIIIGDQCLGAIELANRLGEHQHFLPRDLLVLNALAAATGLAVLSARSTERLIKQERIVKELELAAQIQKSMLPHPRGADFPAYGVNIPARVVSGDFYDFVELDNGRIGFNIGDVAGKGFRSALLMAKTASLYRCLLRSVQRPAELLRLINRELCETNSLGLFVTMIAGLYDPATGLIRLANAGHLPALLRHADGTITVLGAAIPPLGVMVEIDGDSAHVESNFYLDGGALYLFTDGVTESRLPSGEMLGIDGLSRQLRATYDLAIGAQVQNLLDRLAASSGELHDDATLLAIDDRHAAASRSSGDAARMEAQPPVEGEVLAEVTAAARPDRLRLLRQVVGEAAGLSGFGADIAAQIVLAVDEACQNIIRYAYRGQPGGRIALTLYRCSDRFVVCLRDFGEPVDVRKVQPRALDDIRRGGLGTHLIREVMDEVVFESPPRDGGNLLRMVKRIG